ncbi:unnamed protein product, partial [Polarella glacialis]
VGGFVLEEAIGSGAFGTTWKARATENCEQGLGLELGKAVAVKLIRLEDGWGSLDRFEREASVLRRLHHPAVPRYYGSVVRDRPDGRDFGLVSTLVQGQTLDELVRSGQWVADEKNLRVLAETLLELERAPRLSSRLPSRSSAKMQSDMTICDRIYQNPTNRLEIWANFGWSTPNSQRYPAWEAWMGQFVEQNEYDKLIDLLKREFAVESFNKKVKADVRATGGSSVRMELTEVAYEHNGNWFDSRNYKVEAGPPLGYSLVFTTASEVHWPPNRRQAAPAQQGMQQVVQARMIQAQVVGVSNAGGESNPSHNYREEMKFCTGCGKQMEASGQFCPGAFKEGILPAPRFAVRLWHPSHAQHASDMPGIRSLEGRFPKASIAYCLEAEGIEASALEVVAHGWQFGASSTEVRRFAARVAEESTAARAHMLAVAAAFEEVDQNIEARVRSGLDQLGIPQTKSESERTAGDRLDLNVRTCLSSSGTRAS